MGMTPYYADDWLTVYAGDCRAVLATLPAESVHTVCTSPPYWGLRDYGTASWEGGDEGCDHTRPPLGGDGSASGLNAKYRDGKFADDSHAHPNKQQYTGICGKCGAIRQDSQLGLESTPEQYVENMVAVFREVRRVLRNDGTCWLNLGDSYASSGIGDPDAFAKMGARLHASGQRWSATGNGGRGRAPSAGLKPKDLVGIPWRVAFALQQPYYTGTIKDERDRTWLAALMDGEGTFTILSTTSSSSGSISYPPIAQVRMTSAGVVAKAASLVGVASPAQYPPSGTGRAVFQWRLAGRRAADIGRELYPYLIEKRKQALIAWNHQEVRDSYETKRGVFMPPAAREKQQVCRDLIRRLNHGEHVDIPSWMLEPPPMTEPGWYLRSDVIWSKPNPMPESVTDRPTKSHEYLFLLAKSERYYFDADAVREEYSEKTWFYDHVEPTKAAGTVGNNNGTGKSTLGIREANANAGRNIRSVWNIATQPYPGAHFATFPPKLVEPCIKAGTSERGVCPECGAPWRRVVEREAIDYGMGSADTSRHKEVIGDADARVRLRTPTGHTLTKVAQTTTGWQSSCAHDAESIPATVLDPFGGSGTTANVAQFLSRRAILIDLNPEYIEQQLKRNAQTPLGLTA